MTELTAEAHSSAPVEIYPSFMQRLIPAIIKHESANQCHL